MTKQERVLKILDEQERVLNELILLFEDKYLSKNNIIEYESLKKVYENIKILQEEININ